MCVCEWDRHRIVTVFYRRCAILHTHTCHTHTHTHTPHTHTTHTPCGANPTALCLTLQNSPIPQLRPTRREPFRGGNKHGSVSASAGVDHQQPAARCAYPLMKYAHLLRGGAQQEHRR